MIHWSQAKQDIFVPRCSKIMTQSVMGQDVKKPLSWSGELLCDCIESLVFLSQFICLWRKKAGLLKSAERNELCLPDEGHLKLRLHCIVGPFVIRHPLCSALTGRVLSLCVESSAGCCEHKPGAYTGVSLPSVSLGVCCGISPLTV